MATWEQEVQRRKKLIEQAYYQDLGRTDIDEAGMNYWLQEAQRLNHDGKLRDAIRFAGGAQGPATPAVDISSDPTYAAFLRQMDFDEANVQSTLERARAQAQASIASQTPFFDQQRTQATTNVDNNAESRGMFRSGRRLTNRAQARDSIDLNQRQFETNQNTQVADAESNAASQIANIRRQRAEQELATRNRLTQGSVQ